MEERSAAAASSSQRSVGSPDRAGWEMDRDPPPPEASRDARPDAGRRRAVLWSAVVDRLPLGLRGGRFGLDARSVAVVVVAATLGAALGLAYLLRSRPEPVDLPPAVAVSSPTAASLASTPGEQPGVPSGATASGPAQIVVDVEGKVRRPGIVRVPNGSRVIDALQAAGGVLRGTNTAALNLARVLTDGEQVLVGISPPPGSIPASGASGVAAAGPIDLNTATLEQLEELPGVGPVLGQRILDYRAAHGRFTSVDELREVSGIGDKRFAELKDLVRV